MKKLGYIFSTVASVIFVIHSGLSLINIINFLFGTFTYVFFFLTFVFSFFLLIKKIWKPIVLQLVVFLVVWNLFPFIKTDVNYLVYQNIRNEIVQKIIDKRITKIDGTYDTPSNYLETTQLKYLQVKHYSDKKMYVFFSSEGLDLFDFIGEEEGFVYSLSGEVPNNEGYEIYRGYKRINENWFFVSDHEDNLDSKCIFVCE